MEQDYIQIRDLLSQIAGITTIDEDTGQLEAMLNGEETYPIVFPAALILFGDTDWQSFAGERTQRGTGSFTVRLAFDCYDDTHAGAGQDHAAESRHSLRHAVHDALQGLPSYTTGSSYLRTKSRSYSLPGRIKVYEQEYTIKYKE